MTGTLSYLLTIFFLSLGHGAGQPPCPLVLSSYALDTVRGNPRIHLYFLPTPWTRCGATPVSTCTFFLRLGHGAGQPPCPLVLSSYALDTVRGNPRIHLYFLPTPWTRCGATPVSTCTFFLRLGHGAGQPPCPLVLSSYALDTVRGNPRVCLPWTWCGATPVSTCTLPTVLTGVSR